MHVLGVGEQSSTAPGTLTITGTPSPPGHGRDSNTDLPETAPNMKYVLDQVYKSRTWRLSEAAANEQDGRGAFVDMAVQYIHDINAKFGYERAGGPKVGYKNHTTNTLVYKNPDGTTGEKFKIVLDGAGGPTWEFLSRDSAGLEKWYYANVEGDGSQPGGGVDSGSPGGSASNPISVMSTQPDQIRLDVAASWNHYHPLALAQRGHDIGPLDQWVGYASNPDTFSDGKWYLGFNRYWEDRMDCNNPGFPGAADPSGGTKLPRYRA